MKIFYAGARNDHVNPKGMLSFEYQNFYSSLFAFPKMEVKEFPFERILEVGKKAYNEEIFEAIANEKPDIFFVFMYTDELDPKMLARVKHETTTKTVAWFADDYWRFFNYSKHWPPYFHYIVTTYSKAADWYRSAGFNNVLLSQWGCNTETYKPMKMGKDIDVSFVGQKKSGRVNIIDAIQQAGIKVECFGSGWPNGKVSQEEMLKIFSRSKICINLTDRKSIWDPSVLARIFLKKSVNRLVPDFHLIDNLRAWSHFPTPHTHARPFELAGCGAFVISGWSEDIENYYISDKEMAFYSSQEELIEKIKYFLHNDAEREAIAQAGYERTIREHTYKKRFEAVFSQVGFNNF